jgi:hypothetical protein
MSKRTLSEKDDPNYWACSSDRDYATQEPFKAGASRDRGVIQFFVENQHAPATCLESTTVAKALTSSTNRYIVTDKEEHHLSADDKITCLHLLQGSKPFSCRMSEAQTLVTLMRDHRRFEVILETDTNSRKLKKYHQKLPQRWRTSLGNRVFTSTEGDKTDWGIEMGNKHSAKIVELYFFRPITDDTKYMGGDYAGTKPKFGEELILEELQGFITALAQRTRSLNSYINFNKDYHAKGQRVTRKAVLDFKKGVPPLHFRQDNHLQKDAINLLKKLANRVPPS